MTQKTLTKALIGAQSEMGAALKDASNPQYRSSYSTFKSLHQAVVPHLNAHGIFYNATIESECVVTTFTDGESSIHCHVPLQVGKQDAQGYRSAVTYARKCGLELLSGIATADDDDDGNAAAAAAPPSEDEQIARIIERMQNISDLEGLNVAKDWMRNKADFSSDGMADIWNVLMAKEEALAKETYSAE